MFGKLREYGRNFQAKYESIISSKSLFGFSDTYAKAMMEIKEREQKRKLRSEN